MQPLSVTGFQLFGEASSFLTKNAAGILSAEVSFVFFQTPTSLQTDKLSLL